MNRPEEIARSVLHLASDAASYATGTIINVERRRYDIQRSEDGITWETVFQAPQEDVTWDTAFAVYEKVNSLK